MGIVGASSQVFNNVLIECMSRIFKAFEDFYNKRW